MKTNEVIIPVPDILPNNLKIIREMKEKTIAEVSKALDFKKSYISLMENNKANVSNKAVMLIMEYYGVSFNQLFDVKEVVCLPYTINDYEDINLKLYTCRNLLDFTNRNNMIAFDELIAQELKTMNIEGYVPNFDILEVIETDNPDRVLVSLSVKLLKKTVVEKEFNINFLSEIDLELFNLLNEKGFSERGTISLGNNDFCIDNDVILLKQEYNIFKNTKNNIPISTNTLDIKNDAVTVIYNSDGIVGKIEFDALITVPCNIKFIENYLDIDSSDTQKAISLTNQQYNNLLKGEQKISTKTMWRLVKFFRVPLELIIDINVYRNFLFSN